MAIPSQLSPGVEVAGYRIEAVIGRGGMGVVYLAEDLRLKRKVAVKLLSPELAEDEDFRRRFLEESELAASLDHPNVVPIYEAGEAKHGLFIAMRYVEGGDLKERLRRGPLEAADAVALVGQLGDALDAAHARGLVHGDVKPSNALLAPGTGSGGADHVYLADFGLTRRLADGAPMGSGPALGTIDYVAPEQIVGDDVDGRADVYSLGCVLFECLVGRPPYPQQSEAAILFAHLEGAPPSASDARPELGDGIDAVVATALAKAPADRYTSGVELANAAREALGLQEPARPRWWVPGVLALAGVAAIAIAVAAYLVVNGGHGAALAAIPDSVLRIDPATNRTSAPVALDGEPEGVAIGDGAIWVATYRHSSQSQGISRIDPETRAFMRTYDADAGFTTGIAVGAGTVWAMYNRHGPNPHEQLTPAAATTRGVGTDSIQRLRPDGTFAPAATYQYGFQGVAVGSNAVWALTIGGQLWRIDPHLGTVVKRQLPSTFPYHPGLVATGAGAVWVVHGPPACSPSLNSGQSSDCPGTLLTRVDPATAKPSWTVRIPFEPAGVAVDGAAVWLTNGVADSVVRLDPRTGRTIATIPVGHDPIGIAAVPGTVWVTDSADGTVSRIDSNTNRVVRTIAVGERPTGIAADSHGAWVTVAARY